MIATVIATTKTATMTKKSTVVDGSDSHSDSNSEDRNTDGKIHVTRHGQKKKKRTKKQEDYNVKRKKITAEQITLGHRYKAHKTRPGNSGTQHKAETPAPEGSTHWQ